MPSKISKPHSNEKIILKSIVIIMEQTNNKTLGLKLAKTTIFGDMNKATKLLLVFTLVSCISFCVFFVFGGWYLKFVHFSFHWFAVHNKRKQQFMASLSFLQEVVGYFAFLCPNTHRYNKTLNNSERKQQQTCSRKNNSKSHFRCCILLSHHFFISDLSSRFRLRVMGVATMIAFSYMNTISLQE